MDKEFIKERISTIRNSKNISARSLSLNLGMSSEYVNQVENGRLMPSLDFIMNFCDYFNISVAEFFDETIKNPKKYQDLIQELNKMSQPELQQIIDLTKLINKNKKWHFAYVIFLSINLSISLCLIYLYINLKC